MMLNIIKFGLGVIAVVTMSGVTTASARELRIVTQFAVDSDIYRNIEAFARLAKKNSNGRINISVASDTKAEDTEILKGLESGSMAMASIPLEDLDEAIPAIAILEEPFLFQLTPLRKAVSAPGNPVRTPIDRAILDTKKLRVLWWQPLGVAVIVSNGAAIMSPASMSGKKVHVDSHVQSELVTLCGGVPEVSSETHTYDLLKSGGVHAAETAIEGVLARKLWEVAKFMTITRHEAFENVVVISEAIWQAIPPEDQKILTNAAVVAEKELRDAEQAIEEKAISVARANGMQITELSEDDVMAWKNCSVGMIDKFLSKSGELGAQVIQGYRSLVVEAYKSVAGGTKQ